MCGVCVCVCVCVRVTRYLCGLSSGVTCQQPNSALNVRAAVDTCVGML